MTQRLCYADQVMSNDTRVPQFRAGSSGDYDASEVYGAESEILHNVWNSSGEFGANAITDWIQENPIASAGMASVAAVPLALAGGVAAKLMHLGKSPPPPGSLGHLIGLFK